MGFAAKGVREAEKQIPAQFKASASQEGQPLQHRDLCTGLLSLGEYGMVQPARGGSKVTHYTVGPSVGVKPPFLIQSTKKTVGSPEVCHGDVLLPHQSTNWLFQTTLAVYTGRHHKDVLYSHMTNAT